PGRDSKLEIDYLADRIEMNSKVIRRYMNDDRMLEYLKEHNSWFSETRPHIPYPSDLPAAPFEYPDLRYIQDEYQFSACTVVPLQDKLQVYYRDEIGRHQTTPVTLVLLEVYAGT
ncbi:MAG: hypothetical protein M3R15_31070, partial [Acidobacteriota bacterium]|nr:hypothetical protein [Acidobacteriota bacterium]